MTQEELYRMLADNVKDEYNDVIRYVNLSKAAATNQLEGPAQILKDIAFEEFTHAQHVENILKDMGVLKEDNFGLKKNARESLDTL